MKKNVPQQTYIKIENGGEIELAGLSLIGVSSKRGDETKIGFFGSGNKYAIALILREKIPFRIFSGKKEIRITTEKQMFRGNLYEQIVINGRPTSMTTSMGPDWESWFAIREMFCNAVDEGDAKLTVTQDAVGEAGKTCVYIGLTLALEDFFRNREKFIRMKEDEKIATEKTYFGHVTVIKPTAEEFIVFRKNIRINPQRNNLRSLYWYNFSDIKINESRLYQYEHEVLERIASFFAVTDNRDLIHSYLSGWQNHYEKEAEWQYVEDKMSPAWHSILEGKRVYPENLALVSGDFESKMNSFIVPQDLAKLIAKNFPDIEVVGISKDKYFEELIMTDAEQELLQTALLSLKKIGYDIKSKIKLVECTTKDIIAWYDTEKDIIYHTRKHLRGIEELKNTLMEEYFHSIGHRDGQREFVTFLIEELIKSKESTLKD